MDILVLMQSLTKMIFSQTTNSYNWLRSFNTKYYRLNCFHNFNRLILFFSDAHSFYIPNPILTSHYMITVRIIIMRTTYSEKQP